MFNIGDTVVCSNGVCRIEKIGPLAGMGKSVADRSYYTLRPCFDDAATIYVPVDGDDDALRFALDRDEVEKLMEEIGDLDQINISDEKKRETEYRNAVNSKDPRKLIRIIKTMYFRRKARIESGKKSTAIDERYFRIAENRLHEEIALALGIDREEVKEYLRKYIEKK
ncbi:MAG: CarD family transcriptional regulator [Lachnospiraceae bacterium]|nr:CarD family transcriptional regulator [Lachnospiraceae bacterium]